MIEIKKATAVDISTLALLGRVTYVESHGHYIEDKNDLKKYTDHAFSVAKTKQEFNDPKVLFFIVYSDELAVGYAKLVLNATHESISSINNCRLERIYILNDFIPLKIGIQLLNFVMEKAKALKLDTIWLSVYVKNNRAIKFYLKNDFEKVGQLNFLVNKTEYENLVLAKNI